MLCLLSEEARLQKRINSRINRELQRDHKESKREIKLLLLGTLIDIPRGIPRVGVL